MPLKIQNYVSHGYIDNRTLDIVTGRIWLVGRKAPLKLRMKGNCLRDLAGCLLTFKNTSPEETAPFWIHELDDAQNGILGDMTASRRRKAMRQGDTSTCWLNELYIEWFQPELGRILIQSIQYEVEVSEHFWHMDSCQEQAQLMVNQNAMRDYVVAALGKTWEKPQPIETQSIRIPFLPVLKKGHSSSYVMDVYTEVCEKYGSTQDGEVNRAFVMGWDHVLSAMAYTEETGESFYFSEIDECEGHSEMDEITEEEEARVCRGHPLYERIQRFAVQAHEWVKNFPVEIIDTWRPQYRFLQGIYSIIESLTLVLIRISRDEADSEKLVCPLTKALKRAEQVSMMFEAMELPGSEYLREEMLNEWKSIGKQLAKLRFKIERKN